MGPAGRARWTRSARSSAGIPRDAGLGVHPDRRPRPRRLRPRCGRRGRGADRRRRCARARARRRARDAPGGPPRRHGELVEAHLGLPGDHRHPFSARNAAEWTDGALVYVPRNTVVDEPIVLTNVHPAAGTALHWRMLMVLEEGARGGDLGQESPPTRRRGPRSTASSSSSSAQNANLRYLGVQDLNEQTWVFGDQRATVARDAQLEWITLGFGAAQRQGVPGDDARRRGRVGEVTGGYAARGRQHLDFDTTQEHAAPRTPLGPRVPRHPRPTAPRRCGAG